MSDSLEAFLGELPPELAARARDELEPGALMAILAQARERFGGFELDAASFYRHLGRAVAASGEAGWPPDRLQTDELYLALGCARGVDGAAETFLVEYMPTVDSALGQLGLVPDTVDEARASILEALFAEGAAGEPLIASYAGRGPLRGWLRVVAARMARRHVGRVKREVPVPEEMLDAVLAPVKSAELAALKKQLRQDLKQVFAAALARLETDERVLLQSYYLDGMTVDQLAAVYGINRGTVSRRLARTRERLFDDTRAALKDRLRIDSAEFESVMGLMQSQLDLTLPSLLVSEGDRDVVP
jgi:RNA polymerase sigma-70 factor (ECF subfamily)